VGFRLARDRPDVDRPVRQGLRHSCQLAGFVRHKHFEFAHHRRRNRCRHVSPQRKSLCRDIKAGRSHGRRRTNGRPTGKAYKGTIPPGGREPHGASSPACRRHTTANSDNFPSRLSRINVLKYGNHHLGRLKTLLQRSPLTKQRGSYEPKEGHAKDGEVVCFFQPAQKFKTRYATFGFSDAANLDEGAMWPVAFALKELTPTEEARISALVKKAVS